MGLNELALPPWAAVMSVEYRADRIEIALSAPPIVLKPEKDAIMVPACDPVHTASYERILARATAIRNEMHGAGYACA